MRGAKSSIRRRDCPRIPVDFISDFVTVQFIADQAREGDRPSEDDVAQARLGWRGQKERPSADMMTEDAKLQTPSPPRDPGHPA